MCRNMRVVYPFIVFSCHGCVYVMHEEARTTVAELRFSPDLPCHVFLDASRFLVLTGTRLYICDREFEKGPLTVSKTCELSDDVLFMSCVNEYLVLVLAGTEAASQPARRHARNDSAHSGGSHDGSVSITSIHCSLAHSTVISCASPVLANSGIT